PVHSAGDAGDGPGQLCADRVSGDRRRQHREPEPVADPARRALGLGDGLPGRARHLLSAGFGLATAQGDESGAATAADCDRRQPMSARPLIGIGHRTAIATAALLCLIAVPGSSLAQQGDGELDALLQAAPASAETPAPTIAVTPLRPEDEPAPPRAR